MTQVKLPRLLDNDLNEVARLTPMQLSVNLNLSPPSNAAMLLPPDGPSVGMRQYVEIYDAAHESLGIYRAVAVGNEYGQVQEVELEHAIVTLADDLVTFDKDLKEEQKKLEGSMTDILKAILNYQSVKRWRLGTVEATGDDYSLEDVEHYDLLEALLEAVKLADGYYLDYDQTVYPWRLHLKAMPTTPECECRMSRNMEGVKITLDDQELCTRVYSPQLPGGYLDASTVDTWGVISRTIDIPDGTDEAKAKRYATAYVNRRKNPNLNVEIDAVDLSALTGEPLDAFKLAKLCRVSLMEYDFTKDERLISKKYPDLISTPKQVRLTLSKVGRNLARLVAENRRGAGGAGRTANKAMQYVWEHEGTLTLFDKRIELIAADMDSAKLTLDGMKGEIELKVSKDGVISAINMSNETIVISASKINLNGYVTTTALSAWGGTIGATEIRGDVVKATALWMNGEHVVTRSFTGNDGKTYRCLCIGVNT